MTKNTDRLGEIKYNSFGTKMEIVKYDSYHNIDVLFHDKFKYLYKNVSYDRFSKGYLSNPYEKNMYNIGFLGEGVFSPTINGKHTLYYTRWKNMFYRCYSVKFLSKHSTYKDCKVYEEWHNFQNFAKWYDENYYEIEGEEMHLDKDILVKGNKLYSPDTCVFVPQSINMLFVKSNSKRGEYPIGVDFFKRTKKYRSRINIIKNNKYLNKSLGYYDSPEEAFYAYKQAKESYIKEMADKYKDKIPQKLYNVLYNYEVEITD